MAVIVCPYPRRGNSCGGASQQHPSPAKVRRTINDYRRQANFNGFRVLASLLQRRHSREANQTLHDVWPSPARLHYIYIFGGCCPVTEFYQVQNSLSVLHLLRTYLLTALSTGRHLYSAGRPSRWALAHAHSSCFCWNAVSSSLSFSYRSEFEPGQQYGSGRIGSRVNYYN